jgi:hypothetical protein
MNTTVLWITGALEVVIFIYGILKTLRDMEDFDEGEDWNDSITQAEFYKDKSDGQE